MEKQQSYIQHNAHKKIREKRKDKNKNKNKNK
jgi:hypothetical protein